MCIHASLMAVSAQPGYVLLLAALNCTGKGIYEHLMHTKDLQPV